MIASDIDPVAIEVTEAKCPAEWRGRRGSARGGGWADPSGAGKGHPYDLIIANILAGPLTRLAPQIVAALAPGGMLVLSGLLRNQEKMILSFYNRLRRVRTLRDGPWSALVLEKPKR